jgi:hypothetical protein
MIKIKENLKYFQIFFSYLRNTVAEFMCIYMYLCLFYYL